jgi:hypothetical protein
MPTLWRGKSAEFCVLRGLRSSAGRSTVRFSHGQFFVTCAAAAWGDPSVAANPLFAPTEC